MARLIRTEKEVEGRYEEVWLVVEEDALEQWPEGPRDVVGRPATRVTGPLRARGEARYTADLRLPGMLHAAVLRSPHARARVKRIDFSRTLEAPGVRAAVGPGDAHVLVDEPGFHGEAVAAWSQLETDPRSGDLQYRLWASRHAGGAWEPAHALQAGTGWAQSPAVAVDDEGNAAVAWVEHVGATASVWVNRFEVDRR